MDGGRTLVRALATTSMAQTVVEKQGAAARNC